MVLCSNRSSLSSIWNTKAADETTAIKITASVFSDTLSSVFSSILCAIYFFFFFLKGFDGFFIFLNGAAIALPAALQAFAAGLVSTVILGLNVTPTPSANLTSAPTVNLPSSTVAPPPTLAPICGPTETFAPTEALFLSEPIVVLAPTSAQEPAIAPACPSAPFVPIEPPTPTSEYTFVPACASDFTPIPPTLVSISILEYAPTSA